MKLNVTETDIVLVEDLARTDSSAVILKVKYLHAWQNLTEKYLVKSKLKSKLRHPQTSFHPFLHCTLSLTCKVLLYSIVWLKNYTFVYELPRMHTLNTGHFTVQICDEFRQEEEHPLHH